MLRDRFYWIDLYIAAGALATQYRHGATKQTVPTRGNLPRDGEVEYPIAVTEVGVSYWGSVADWERIFWQSKFHFEVGSSQYPEFPGTALLGGGGFTFAGVSGTGVAAGVDQAQNGIPNGRGTILAEPIALEPGITFSFVQDVATGITIAEAVQLRIFFRGIEAKPVR
jgi:hypothetical protein